MTSRRIATKIRFVDRPMWQFPREQSHFRRLRRRKSGWSPRMVTGFAMKTTAPIALEGLSQAGRGLAMQAAVRQAADDLAARFPESEGFRHKIVEFPTWAEKKVFGAEICFRRGVAAGFNVTVSVSTKDREKAAINVMAARGSSGWWKFRRQRWASWPYFGSRPASSSITAAWASCCLWRARLAARSPAFRCCCCSNFCCCTAGMATSNAELNDALTIVEQAISKTVGICPG